jgi:uncharacterized protein YndB with AHSA1/START domain
MTNETAATARGPIKFERRYDASVEDLGNLWTTKEGFESWWWGPEGFRVETCPNLGRAWGQTEIFAMLSCILPS